MGVIRGSCANCALHKSCTPRQVNTFLLADAKARMEVIALDFEML